MEEHKEEKQETPKIQNSEDKKENKEVKDEAPAKEVTQEKNSHNTNHHVSKSHHKNNSTGIDVNNLTEKFREDPCVL